MLFASVVFLAVFLGSSGLVFSTSTGNGDLAEFPEGREHSPLVKLFSEYQFGNSWKVAPLPLNELSLYSYFQRIDANDFKQVLKSFKECKDIDELQHWQHFMLSELCKPVLIATLRNIGDEVDLVDIDDSEKAILEEIINSWVRPGDNYGDLKTLIMQPLHTLPTDQRQIVAGILANKRCLLAVIVSAYKQPQNRWLFIEAILPLLDNETRSQFLRFLEKEFSMLGLPVDVAHWRHWKCLEQAEVQEEETWSEIMPNEIIPAAEPTDESYPFFEYDVVEDVLAQVDLNTLLHSVPCVNKLLSMITPKIISFRLSQDLDERLNFQAQIIDPYSLSTMYPWNAIFSSPRQLVKYHLLYKRNTTDKRWLTAALETMTKTGTENDFELGIEREYGNEEMLKHCLMHADLNGVFRNKTFPLSALVRLFDIILQDELPFKGNLAVLTTEKLLYLVRNVKEGAKMLQLLYEKYVSKMFHIYVDIMFLDYMKMPEEVLKVAEKYASEQYEQNDSLPLTAPKILSIQPNVLAAMMLGNSNYALHIKIFNVFFDHNAIDNWNRVYWEEKVLKMLRVVLFEDPTLMTPKQFEALLAFADDATRKECFECMQSVVRHGSEIRTNNTEQN